MFHKIFLSHNHNDKPIVEKVALKLASIFGQDQVFYDSWSIRPGDGIIDQINKGLEAPEFVFFFVTKNSLESGMVKLEWQNSLYFASKGKTRIIPVRIDGTEMPAVLRQTLYIDMHTIGLDAAIAQIVSVTQGQASFTPQHQGFSNITFTKSRESNGSINVVIRASHLMEPNAHFSFVTKNTEAEIAWKFTDERPFLWGFTKGCVTCADGTIAHAISMRPLGAALTPDHPIRVTFTKLGESLIEISDVLHQKTEKDWTLIPVAK